MNTFFYRVSALALFFSGCLLLPQSAFATPEALQQQAANRFSTMDANKDSKISEHEFFAAQPNMSSQAFLNIDIDADKFITPEEWYSFTETHSTHSKVTSNGTLPDANMGKAGFGQDANTTPHNKHDMINPRRSQPAND